MITDILRLCAIICTAFCLGKLVSKIKLPAILGWLVTGVVFGPHLAQIVSSEIVSSTWYKIVVKFFECFAGVMIGKEIIFKKIAGSGKQIIGITFVQSLGTFLVVSLAFAVTFWIANVPVYIAFVLGGIALATAPAPALSIVNQYHTQGPVTKTLIPLAAIDDVIGIVVFFTVMSFVSMFGGGQSTSVLSVVGMVLLPFAIGIALGFVLSFVLRKVSNSYAGYALLLAGLCISVVAGLLIDLLVFGAFSLNYLLIGLSYTATIANLVDESKLEKIFRHYSKILNFSLVVVIVNLGLPLDYRLIAGAGLFTAIYILSRAAGKIGGAFLGGKLTKAEPTVTKYLGLTLLPHSGVSLVFTGIAVSTLSAIDPSHADVVSGTIVAAAIINEIIAVVTAKVAFSRAHEIPQAQS